ncbi:hypothetical protein [Flagellimonas sp. SN16]|uniref:hypothetical protein n=1 Tax=Flagellimonas sp. SN16 TaxID=3415142 RepID=UPI003C63F152
MEKISFQWVNPISKDFENVHQTIMALGSRAIPVPAKGRFWNTGPTAFDKKKAWKIMDRSGRYYVQVIEIWYRNDGFHNRAFKYESEAAYNNYVGDDTTHHAIAKEIGY